MGCGPSSTKPLKERLPIPTTKEELMADDKIYFRGIPTILNSEIAAIYK